MKAKGNQHPRFAPLFMGIILSSVALFSACGPVRSPIPTYEQFMLQNTPAPPSSTECDQLCTDRRSEFRYVIYIGKQIYAYWDLKRAETGTDFEALAEQLGNSITSSTTETEYYEILRRWASAFHDGHVNVIARDDLSDIEIYSAPVRLEVLAPATDHEKVIVVDQKDVPYLNIGDEVQAVNTVPIKDALDEAEKSVSGSTRRMRRYWAAKRLVDVLGIEKGSEQLILTVLSKTGRRTVVVPRSAELNAKKDSGAPAPSVESSGINNLKASVLPGMIGYLRIDGFGGSQSSFLIGQAMDRLQRTKALLIDVRANGGGDQSGNSVLARLAEKDLVRYRVSENISTFVLSERPQYFLQGLIDGTEPFAHWHDIIVKSAPPALHYGKKPVMVLTGPACFSACDTFTSALKSNGLAKIAGEATGGGTGTPLVFELPVSKHHFRYSVVRGQTPSGEWIEGYGTLPDIVIEPTAADRIAKHDVQLDRAVDFLRLSLPEAPASSGSNSPDMNVYVEGVGTVPIASDRAPIWSQDMSVSPTRAENARLSRIVTIDEQPDAMPRLLEQALEYQP